MKIVFAPGALADVVEARRWWREHRPDAPDAMATALEAALRDLPRVALSLPTFRRVASVEVRRLHVPRVHRHLYFQVTAEGDLVVLAVWGAVRRVLPQLRQRARSMP